MHVLNHACTCNKVNDKTAKVGASVFGQTFKLALSNWETWVIYTSESVMWKLSSGNEVKVCPLVVVVSLLLLVVVVVALPRGGVPISIQNISC